MVTADDSGNASKSENTQEASDNILQMKLLQTSQPNSREKSEKALILETTNVLSTKRNNCRKGTCNTCNKRKFVFTLYFKPTPLVDEEVIEKACSKCLFKKIPKKSLIPFIQGQANWSTTEPKEPFSKELAVFINFCRQREVADLDEDLAIVNSIMREKIKKMLTMNGDMVALMGQYHMRMNCKERMIAFKIIHDTTDNILRLNTLIQEPKVSTKLKYLTEVEQRSLLEEIKLYFTKLVPHDRVKDFALAFPYLESLTTHVNGKGPMKVTEATEPVGEIFIGKRAPLDPSRLPQGSSGFVHPNIFDFDHDEVASVRSMFSDYRELRLNNPAKH